MDGKSLTTKEIAQYCQVTQRTIVQWINEGKLKSFRTLGKHIRVVKADFIEFLNSNRMPIPEEISAFMAESGKKKILIVVDDVTMADSIVLILREENGFELEVAYSGFEAGRKYNAFKPHLMIIDLNMPGISGYDLCRIIRENTKNNDVKILAIAGVKAQKDIDHVLKLGVDDFLARPFESKVLKVKLAKLFGWSKRAEDVLRKDKA